MSEPWLSVLMPVYAGAKTLPRTLASLLGEAQGIEVIAVLQESPDASGAILQQAAERLPLRIVPAPEGRNWVRNTNHALAEARAPFVTMLHQDDLWRPGRNALLRRLVATGPDCSLWLHGADYVDLADRVVGSIAPAFGPLPRIVPGPEALRRLIVQNSVALPAAMFRRTVALAGGGLDESLWYTADWDLWLRLVRQGAVGWEPQRAAAFRIHSGSLTVSGSRDLDSLRAQLDIPRLRHIEGLPEAERRQVARCAEAAACLNLCLAAGLRGRLTGFRDALCSLTRLDLAGWARLGTDGRFFTRLWPRLRILLLNRAMRNE